MYIYVTSFSSILYCRNSEYWPTILKTYPTADEYSRNDLYINRSKSKRVANFNSLFKTWNWKLWSNILSFFFPKMTIQVFSFFFVSMHFFLPSNFQKDKFSLQHCRSAMLVFLKAAACIGCTAAALHNNLYISPIKSKTENKNRNKKNKNKTR